MIIERMVNDGERWRMVKNEPGFVWVFYSGFFWLEWMQLEEQICTHHCYGERSMGISAFPVKSDKTTACR